MSPRRRRRLAAKRAIDVLGAIVGLTLLSPVIVATALALLVSQGRPVFFRQQRPGLHGELFSIVKFRTMRSPRPDEVWYASDPQRVTRLGRFLRRSSLDELPELWNVLRGEMSLVGPRPLLAGFLPNYTPEEARRHEMRPGVTGWAVVNGRQVLRRARPARPAPERLRRRRDCRPGRRPRPRPGRSIVRVQLRR